MAGNRTIIGSEADDTKHVDLDRFVSNGKVTLPVSLYDANGAQVSTFGTAGESGPFSSVTNGRATVATVPATPAQFPSVACSQVIITALARNAGTIYVGDSTTNATVNAESGSPLLPTASILLNIKNLSSIYYAGTNTGDTITYIYLS